MMFAYILHGLRTGHRKMDVVFRQQYLPETVRLTLFVPPRNYP